MNKPIREYEISNSKDGRLSFVVDNTEFGKYRLELNRAESHGFYYNFINLTQEELEHLSKAINTELSFWYKTSHGKCPQCGRERDLGQINDKFQDQFTDRCIDCCFGPPMEYWDMCDVCGQLFVGEHCNNQKCESGKNYCRGYGGK